MTAGGVMTALISESTVTQLFAPKNPKSFLLTLTTNPVCVFKCTKGRRRQTCSHQEQQLARKVCRNGGRSSKGLETSPGMFFFLFCFLLFSFFFTILMIEMNNFLKVDHDRAYKWRQQEREMTARDKP